MSAPARLLALRLHGFKSFAEKTLVEFGPGISAIVGPNGSGKSNLADGLRWALGEQGRSLRIRRSEDVVWAGSEQRAAVGMADVALVLDNADGLLPVEYGQVELGRRLYRSGENDYLLNRQRVRLRDLVDLLDAANLADNAFLFIGQGMVDQALALRPEERRPLFEEVAGVRRHERRRRKSEEQLAESESNLARVEDILGELRPQARRLAVQAEQQANRATAGEVLAEAVVLAAHARWYEASSQARSAASVREHAQAESSAAMSALADAEAGLAAMSRELDEHSRLETERRAAHEAARARLVEAQLRQERLASDIASLERDQRRLSDERSAADADIAVQQRALALPAPERDVELERALGDAERSLAEALAELAALHSSRDAEGEQRAAATRASAARLAELETARRRHAVADRRAADEAAEASALMARRAALETEVADRRGEHQRAGEAIQAAIDERDRARQALDASEAERAAALARAAAADEAAATARARLAAIAARLDEEEARGIGRAARRRGGRRVDEELAIEPSLRAAVEAALGDASRGYVLGRSDVSSLSDERGTAISSESLEDEAGKPDRPGSPEPTLVAAVERAGGGWLADAIRRDQVGAASRLLSHAIWTPDLATALDLQSSLPAGWVAVIRDGSAVVGPLVVRFGRVEGVLDWRADRDRLSAEVDRLDAEARDRRAEADRTSTALVEARDVAEAARRAVADSTAAAARTEEALRSATRALDAAIRETSWHEAQATRLAAEAERARQVLEGLEPVAEPEAHRDAVSSDDGGNARATWQARVEELRRRRDRLASELGSAERTRTEVLARRARAEAALALDEDRVRAAEREALALADRVAAVVAEREAGAAGLSKAQLEEHTARAALDDVTSADIDARQRLTTVEQEATTARERLRACDERLRAAEVADLEARLGLESVREGTLLELAGLGPLGLSALRPPGLSALGSPGLSALGSPAGPLVPAVQDDTGQDEGPDGSTEGDGDDADDTVALERALEEAAISWAARAPSAEPPSPARLAQLRRRYHELGSANPFAVEEYAEVRARLESLETQERDLRAAIATTRQLIAELNAMIADQFRQTFSALESAFDRRFRQLFGGGYAQLALTDPSDLSTTGVEIVARPPGKKAQALAMLSGGERALTAVALLFAMLEVRPVPFCVLDEVDAALDEANVGRFTDALRSLADATQFVVITHNRGTIEQADALYGVTVGSDSVSRVISLRLDEAQAIAARDREGSLAEAAVG